MNKIFKDMIGKNLAVYLDDITIFLETFEQHLEILEKVFNRLRENRLFIKLSKCELATDWIKLLEFVLDEDGLWTDSKKVSAIAKFPRPVDQSTVRAFLRLGKYYKRFIQNFSTIIAPLNELLQKDQEYY